MLKGMKKILPAVFVLIIYFFFGAKPIFANCSILGNSSAVANTSYSAIIANIAAKNLYTYQVNFQNTTTGGFSPGGNFPFLANPMTVSLTAPEVGLWKIKVAGIRQGSVVPDDFCESAFVLNVTGSTSSNGGNDTLKNSPKDWLKNVNPGFTPPWGTNFGLDFFTKQLVPFLVWAGVFFTIILSLIFLIIGGIMYSMAGGNKEGMAKAKATITYAIVGLVLGLSSVIILRFLENFFLAS